MNLLGIFRGWQFGLCLALFPAPIARRVCLTTLLAMLGTAPPVCLAQQQSDSAEVQQPNNAAQAEQKVEYWIGTLQLGGFKLHLRLEVQRPEQETEKLSATLISIDQGNAEIPLDEVQFADGKLTFESQKIQAKYVGTLNESRDKAVGKFTQFGNTLDLELRKVDNPEVEQPARPQTPKPPFPYVSQDVWFENKTAGITLAGTMTVPLQGSNFPAVVLVTGSGPQDRDETLLQHKPFLVIADHLSRNGIAVLRYDDRGVGKSKGEFASSTTNDFAEDAAAAIEYLAERDDIDTQRIGVIGHSEGAIVASRLAASDQRLAHVVLLAGPGIPGSEVIISQAAAIATKSGQIDLQANLRKKMIDLILRDAPRAELEQQLDQMLGSAPEDAKSADQPTDQANADSTPSPSDQSRPDDKGQATRMLRLAFLQMDSPWFRQFLKHDPRVDLRKAQCPVLALNGENDLQVLPELNLPEVEKALAESPAKGHRCLKLEKLNHLFQESETGLPAEYGELTQTISTKVLDILTEWIKSH